ncbi:MAG: hypothetical protein AB7Q01_14985 [Gammaproteobacteria bacterium]
MATYVAIHTATGVVRRVTTDAAHAFGRDEQLIEVETPPDFKTGRPKLVDGKYEAATEAEIDAADKLPLPDEVVAIVQAAADVIADPLVPASVKTFVGALRALYRPSRLGLK